MSNVEASVWDVTGSAQDTEISIVASTATMQDITANALST